jgi:hypothetical protein
VVCGKRLIRTPACVKRHGYSLCQGCRSAYTKLNHIEKQGVYDRQPFMRLRKGVKEKKRRLF